MYVDVRTRNVTYVERFYPQSRCMFFFSLPLYLSLLLSIYFAGGKDGSGGREKGSRTVYGKYIWPVKKELEREEGITADFGGNPNDSARKFREIGKYFVGMRALNFLASNRTQVLANSRCFIFLSEHSQRGEA